MADGGYRISTAIIILGKKRKFEGQMSSASKRGILLGGLGGQRLYNAENETFWNADHFNGLLCIWTKSVHADLFGSTEWCCCIHIPMNMHGMLLMFWWSSRILMFTNGKSSAVSKQPCCPASWAGASRYCWREQAPSRSRCEGIGLHRGLSSWWGLFQVKLLINQY